MGDYNSLVKAPALRRRPTREVVGDSVGWFDGVALSSGIKHGVGGIIRTIDNCMYKWTINCKPSTNTRAELLGAWSLLTLASRLSIMKQIVQGDLNIVIEWMWGKGHL